MWAYWSAWRNTLELLAAVFCFSRFKQLQNISPLSFKKTRDYFYNLIKIGLWLRSHAYAPAAVGPVILHRIWIHFYPEYFSVVILPFLCMNLLHFSRWAFLLVISAHQYMKKEVLGKLLSYVTSKFLTKKNKTTKKEEMFFWSMYKSLLKMEAHFYRIHFLVQIHLKSTRNTFWTIHKQKHSATIPMEGN